MKIKIWFWFQIPKEC